MADPGYEIDDKGSLAVAYAVISVPTFIYFSRSTRRKVEESQRRYSSS